MTDPPATLSPTVAPVCDYEPPACASTPRRSAPRKPLPAVRLRRGQPARPGAQRPVRRALPAPLQSAAVFADAALRRVLEVVDQRRPSAHLYPLLAAGLADSVLSVCPPAGRTCPATLQRVRVQPAGGGEPARAVEVFGTYRRGQRTHALACRVEQTAADTGWQIVALHIG